MSVRGDQRRRPVERCHQRVEVPGPRGPRVDGSAPSCATTQEGFVAGAEALVFGVLVFVFGTLMLVNGWAVLDAKFATNAAAREAVRAVAAADPGTGAEVLAARASAAASEAVRAHGYDPEVVAVDHLTPLPPGRCDAVRVRARISVRSTIIPGVAGPATFGVGSEHEQVLDPFRSGLAEGIDCGF